jgi:hypothetical protein
MAHVDLSSASSVSMASVGSPRTITVLGGDSTTKVTFYNADAASASSGATIIDTRYVNRKNPLVLKANEVAVLNDASSYLGYLLTGTAPTAVYVDGPGAGTANAAVATTSAAGTAVLTTAPGSTTAPTVVSSTDPRVASVTAPVTLSGSNGALAETPIWRAPVPGTITGAYIETGSATMAASNTNYVTFTVSKRPLSGPGTAATVVANDTKAADLNGTTAWTEVSLGSVSNATFVAGDIFTFTAAATSSGQAGAPSTVRLTFTPTV